MKAKKLMLVTITILFLIFVFSSCGENNVDIGKHAIISLPDGTIVEGKCESLTRWSASLVDITIDGTSYSVHPYNIALIKGEIHEN